MPRFEPFPGLRYRTEDGVLDDVTALPYDVISPEEQAALESRSEHNAVRVELPRDDAGLNRYENADRLLRSWQDDGVLGRDPASFYVYRMDFRDEAGRARHTLGVIGALGLEEPGTGDILPHEHTTPKAKSDRLDLLRATSANLSPVWGLSMAAGLSDACRPEGEPDARATDTDGVVHSLWVLDDAARVEAVSAAVGSAPVVIADGHHRYETAFTYRTEQRAASGGRPGDADLVMALIVELADEQLSVRAIHRLLSGLPDDVDLPAAFARHFEVTSSAAADASITERMQDAGALALLTRGGTWLLRPRAETLTAATHDLDSSRLDVALQSLPPHELVYQHGWDLAAAAVDKGDADAAVLLRPATVAQIAETGRSRVRMPPKTTFFWPKPRTGMVFRTV